MKKMMMIGVVMMMSTIIFAQHKKQAPQREGQREAMKSELALSETQYASISDIDKKYATRQRALRKDSLQTREAKHTALKSLNADRKREVDAVLTAEQKQKWSAYRAKQAADKQQMKKLSAEARALKMKTSLRLSDEQFAKVQAVQATTREKYRKLKTDSVTVASAADRKKAHKTIQGEEQTAIKAILSEQQYQQWLTMKREKRKHRRQKMESDKK